MFAGCLFFDIGSSSADFLDLERCRKVRQRPLVGDCSATGRFALELTKIPADAPPMSRRRSAGARAVTVGAPVDDRQTTMNRAIICKSPFGERAAIHGFAMGSIL